MNKLSLLSLFFFFSFVASQNLPWSLEFSNSNGANQVFFTDGFSVPLLNALGTLSLSASGSANNNIWVCGKLNLQPTPYFATWSASTCTFFQKYDNTSIVATLGGDNVYGPRKLDLVEGDYYLAVLSTGAANFSLTLAGKKCTNDNYGPNCASSQVLDANTPYLLAVPSNSTRYFSFNLSSEVPRPSVINFVSNKETRYNVKITLRSGNVPFYPIDYDGSWTLLNNLTKGFSLSVPTPGLWYLGIIVDGSPSFKSRRAVPVTTNLTFTPQFCPNGQAGNPCQNVSTLSRTDLAKVWTFQTQAGQWQYFQLPSYPRALNFTVQLTDGSSNAAPALYLRRRQVPDETSYDSVSLNNTVNSVGSNQFSRGVWFLGIKGTGASYSLWFNSTCPNACSNNGDCVFVNNAYQCQCHSNYALFDCSQNNNDSSGGFKTEYIVLIVIGSIIALAALLGVIVYLYNRGRHPGGGYERI